MPLTNGISRTLRALVPAALIAVAGLGAVPAAAQQPSVIPSATFDALMARAQEAGRVRVIVGLDVATRPEGGLSAAAQATQRAAIASAQQGIAGILGGESVIRNFETVPYTVLRLTPAQLERLRATPGMVTSIVEDGLSEPFLAESTRLIMARRVWQRGIDGTGYTVAVLDTGISYASRAFRPLNEVIPTAACFSSNDPDSSSTSLCRNGVTSDWGRRSAPDADMSLRGAGHGTHVASTVVGRRPWALMGVAPGARVIPIQVFSAFPASECSAGVPCVLSFWSDQIAGLEQVGRWADSYDIAAVNISIGGGLANVHCDAGFAAYAAVVSDLRSRGVAVVIASGNDGSTTATSYPACISDAVTVGATNDADGIASFSNQAANIIDLMAPGVAITAAYPTGRNDTATLQGTSMAAPHVAGAFALMRQVRPTATVDEIEDALRCTGVPVTRDGTTGTFYRIDVRLARLQLLHGNQC